jgi:hypothetical protein
VVASVLAQAGSARQSLSRRQRRGAINRNASIPGVRENLGFLRHVAAAMIGQKIAPTVNAFTRAPLSAA